MTDFTSRQLLATQTAQVWDVRCRGACKHRSAEECAAATHLVFPYRGVYVHHADRGDAVAEANQVVFINGGEGYRVSHPVAGGDASLSLFVVPALLDELAPAALMDRPMLFNRPRLRIDPQTQALAALLRHVLMRGPIEPLEAETLVLTLVRRALGEGTSHAAGGSAGRQKLADRAKLVLASDLSRRWTLAEIAGEVGVSPVYLTQVFQQVEGAPLYRYQLRLRLARALDVIADCDDLAGLGLELGFASHSHFTAAFRGAYGRTPANFRKAARAA